MNFGLGDTPKMLQQAFNLHLVGWFSRVWYKVGAGSSSNWGYGAPRNGLLNG